MTTFVIDTAFIVASLISYAGLLLYFYSRRDMFKADPAILKFVIFFTAGYGALTLIFRNFYWVGIPLTLVITQYAIVIIITSIVYILIKKSR